MKHKQTNTIVQITKKALDSFRNKEAAFHAGVNAGIELGYAQCKARFHSLNYGTPLPQPEPKWRDVGERFLIAGVQYGDYQLICGGLKPGTVVQLVGEPSNPWDQKAVRIDYNGIKLGYIPKDQGVNAIPTHMNDYCWELHRCGYKLIGVVTEWIKVLSDEPHPAITIQIKQTTTCPSKQTERPKDVRF